MSQAGFLKLPSVSTLKSYLNFTKPVPHINHEIVQLLLNEFNVKNALDYNRDVVIVWDEMKIRSGLVVSRGSGELIGFTQLDNISEGIHTLESASQSNDGDTSELATHIMVFTVWGLLNSVSLPFIWYPCTGFSADQLWGAVWTATKLLENNGLRVRAWTCDGTSSNHTFFSCTWVPHV